MTDRDHVVVGNWVLPKLKEVLGLPRDLDIEWLELRAAREEFVTVKIGAFVPRFDGNDSLAEGLRGIEVREFEVREYEVVSTEQPCRDCQSVGFRLTEGLCDGCYEQEHG